MSESLSLKEIHQSFYQGQNEIKVLEGINVLLNKSEKIALTGSSGSGKSSLLHIAGLLEKPMSGEICLDGKSVTYLNDNQKTELRRTNIGFVYQSFALLAEFTALENILIPMLINKTNIKYAKERAQYLLKKTKMDHTPYEKIHLAYCPLGTILKLRSVQFE